MRTQGENGPGVNRAMQPVLPGSCEEALNPIKKINCTMWKTFYEIFFYMGLAGFSVSEILFNMELPGFSVSEIFFNMKLSGFSISSA